MDRDEIDHRFLYHPPQTDAAVHAHEQVREGCRLLAQGLNDTLPDGREKSLAITSLEQVMFWANAAIARQPPEPT